MRRYPIFAKGVVAIGNAAVGATMIAALIVGLSAGTGGASPVAYWMFDEGSGTTANNSVAGGPAGTLVNGPTWVTGYTGSGYALSFSGSNYVDVTLPTTAFLSDTTSTVSMWVKSTAGGGFFSINDPAQGGSNDRNAWISGTNANYRVWQNTAGEETITTSGVNVADGNWHQVVIQYGTTTGHRVYVDGVLRAYGDAAYSAFNWKTHLEIGWASFGGYFNGQIDDVAVWNEILTPAQIANIFSGTSPLGVSAGSTDWTGATADWTTANWSAGVPSNLQTANVSNGGTVQITSGTANPGLLQIGGGSGGTVSLNGGTLATGGVYVTTGGTLVLGGGTLAADAIRLDGGTLRAAASFNINPPTDIGSGGATVDTAGFDGTLGGSIVGPGALNKIGAGTLTLAAANSYRGDTKITGGTLLLGHSLALQGSTLDYNNYGGTLSFGSLTAATFGGLKGGQSLALPANLALTVGGNNQSTSYTGALSGSGASLTKVGSGILTLSAVQSYTGGTNVNGGTLKLTSGNDRLATGGAISVGGGLLDLGGYTQNTSGAVSILSGYVQNGTINKTGGADYNVQGGVVLANLAGNVGLTKSGSGTALLSSTNTFTGPVTISGGTLKIDVLGASSLWLDATDTAHIAKDASNVVTTWSDKTGKNVNVTQATAAARPTYVTSAINGLPAIHFDSSGTADRLYNNVNYTSPVTVFSVSQLTGGNNRRLITSSAGNWLLGYWGGAMDKAYLEGWVTSSSTTPTADANNPHMYEAVIRGTGGNSDVYVYDNQRTSVTLLASNQNGVSGPNGLSLGTSGSYSGESADGDVGEILIFGGALTAAQRQVVESYLISKWFGGTAVFAIDAIPDTAPVNITASGAKLDLNGYTETIGPLSGVAGSAVTLGTGTLTVNSTADSNFAGTISGAGGLVKAGPGALTLSGGAGINYTGSTAVNSGQLVLFNATAYNSPTTVKSGAKLSWSGNANMANSNAAATIALESGATLENLNPANWTILGAAVTVSGTATINQSSNATGVAGEGFFLDGGLKGTGTVIINAANPGSGVGFRNNNTTFSGTMIVNGIASATPFAGSGIAVGGCTTGLTNADITLNGTMELLNQGIGWANGAPGDFWMGALSGSGVMVANYTTGGQTRVRIGNTNNSGTFSGVIADGTGNQLVLTKNGAGTQTFTGALTYTGTTTINGGTLQLGDGTAGHDGSLATGGVVNNAVLAYNLAGNQTVGYPISGTGALLKAGPGTLTLTAVNSYAAGTTITGGTLAASGNAALGSASGPLTIDGGTLRAVTKGILASRPVTLNAGGGTIDTGGLDSVLSGNIGGPGGLTKTGAGTLFLGGTGTYAGTTTISQGTLKLAGAAPAGAVAIYDFEGNANDSSGHGYNGALQGGAQISGGALVLGGYTTGDYVSVPNMSSEFASAGTVTLWVKLAAATPGVGNNTGLVGFGGTGNNHYPWTDGQAYNTVLRADGNRVNNIVLDPTIDRSQWHLVTITSDPSGGWNMYQNGTLVRSTAAVWGINNWMIGRDAGNYYLQGSIDQVYLYSRALSATEVVQLFAMGRDPAALAAINPIPDASPVAISAGAALDVNGRNETIGSLSGVAGSQVLLGSGTLTTGGNNSSTTFAGSISGAGGLVKAGAGAMTLSGSSTYTGATAVTAGKLLVDGSITSPVTVSGGVLGGNGSIAGNVTIQPAGSVSAGDSPGHLAITGFYSQAGTMLAEIGGYGQGTTYDWIEVTGAAAFTGATVDVLLVNGFHPQSGDFFDVFTATGGMTVDQLSLTGDPDQLAPAQYWAYRILGSAGGPQTLQLFVAVPEPSTLVLAALGLLGLFAVGRRRKKDGVPG